VSADGCEVVGRAKTMADRCWQTMAADDLTSTADPRLRNRPVRLSGDEGLGQRQSQINLSIEQTGTADHYFDHTGMSDDFQGPLMRINSWLSDIPILVNGITEKEKEPNIKLILQTVSLIVDEVKHMNMIICGPAPKEADRWGQRSEGGDLYRLRENV